MPLALVSVVRNEADVIEAWVRHHARMVDTVHVLDDRSDDDTSAILQALQAEGLPLRVVRNDDPSIDRAIACADLARQAATATSCEALIALDADEFLLGTRAAFEDALSDGLARDVLALARYTRFPDPAAAPDAHPFERAPYSLRGDPGLPGPCVIGGELARSLHWTYADDRRGIQGIAPASPGPLPSRTVAALRVAHLPARSGRQFACRMLRDWFDASVSSKVRARGTPRYAFQRHVVDLLAGGLAPESLPLASLVHRYRLVDDPTATHREPDLMPDPIPALPLRHTRMRPADPLRDLARRLDAYLDRLVPAPAPGSRPGPA